MNTDKPKSVLSVFICVHLWPVCFLAFLPVERVPRPPIRQLVLVGDVLAEQKTVLRGLPQRGEIPIALEFVRWLVVMLAVVFLVGLLAEAGRLAREFGGVPRSEEHTSELQSPCN